jgi:hypothetical protein
MFSKTMNFTLIAQLHQPIINLKIHKFIITYNNVLAVVLGEGRGHDVIFTS